MFAILRAAFERRARRRAEGRKSVAGVSFWWPSARSKKRFMVSEAGSFSRERDMHESGRPGHDAFW